MGIATLVGVKPKKELIGLDKVENKDSETIRSEITSDNISEALGYTPYKEDTSTIIGITSDKDSAVLTYDDGKVEEISVNGNDGVVVNHHDGTIEELIVNGDGSYTVTETDTDGNVIRTTTIMVDDGNISLITG